MRKAFDLLAAVDNPAAKLLIAERKLADAENELRELSLVHAPMVGKNIRLESELARARYERLDIAITRHLVQLDEAKPVPGVYLLFGATGEVIYVGQSENVLARMAGHSDKPYARARMIALRRNQLGSVEKALIQHFQPKFNTHHRLAA